MAEGQFKEESYQITVAAKLSSNSELLKKCLDENNELISIFVKSINTAKRKTLEK
jgi:hypothetical protein